MKKLFVLALALVFAVTTFAPETFGQDRRKKKNRGLATNLAIVGGSTAAGAIIGRGRNGAAIGAGAGLLYASSRKGTKRRYQNSKTRRWAKVAGGTLLGTGLGAAIGGKKGAIIGALGGGAGTYLYTRKKTRSNPRGYKRNYRRN